MKNPIAAKYVTKQILGGLRGNEEVIMPHTSLAELISYLKFQNLLIGDPAPLTPRVSVEHADGSPLSNKELERIKEGGISTEKYAERIVAATKNFGHHAAIPTNPDDGAIQSAVLRDLRKPGKK